jgi:hypothetical protein
MDLRHKPEALLPPHYAEDARPSHCFDRSSSAQQPNQPVMPFLPFQTMRSLIGGRIAMRSLESTVVLGPDGFRTGSGGARSGRLSVGHRAAAPWLGSAAVAWSCLECGKDVCTMCTLSASDWAVHRPDCLGFGMFSGVPSVWKGWSAVRVPPRAQQVPSSEGIFALTCVQNLWWRPSDADARALALPPRWPVKLGGWRDQDLGWWVLRPLFTRTMRSFLRCGGPGWPLTCSWSVPVLMT